MMRFGTPVLALSALLLPLAGGCEDVETHVYASNLPQKSVEVDVQELGGLSEKTVRFYEQRPEVDAVLRLPKGSCPEACQFLEATVWVRNKSDNNIAPPVVRLSSPEGRPPRAPVPLGAHEITMKRIGRIRLLVELWPEETEIDVDVSGSTFFEVFEAETDKGGESENATADNAQASVDGAKKPTPRAKRSKAAAPEATPSSATTTAK